jgi:hypothetical protein
MEILAIGGSNMRNCLALLALSLICLAAMAQDCGTNPEQNYQFSSSFKQATLHDACSASKDTESLMTEYGVLSGGQDSSACSHDAESDESASQSIQTEIQNNRAAIVAVCGYYACKMSSTSASVPNIAAYAAVCGDALNNPDSGHAPQDFKIIPAFTPVVVSQPKQSVRIYVENTSNGPLEFDKPQSTDARVRVTSPSSSKFTVKAHSGQWLTVQLQKPTSDDLPVLASLPVMVHHENQDAANALFSMGTAPTDFLPALSLGCGELNPHMTATAFSDRKSDNNYQGFPPKTARVNAFTAVPNGAKTNFESAGAEYHNNGKGWININMDSSCTQLDATRSHASVVLSFTTATVAMSGECCSGAGPGGTGTTNPEWREDFKLPGNPSKNKWSMDVIALTRLVGPSPTCSIQMDGVAAGLSPNAQKTTSYTLLPGAHQLIVLCKEGEIGSRPGGWLSTGSFDEQFNVTVDTHLNQ